MLSKYLGLLSDLIALLFVWVKVENASLWGKIGLTLVCSVVAVLIIFLEKGSYAVKVIDYLYENGKVKHVFIHKNSNFTENSLVSVYYNPIGDKQLSAIGYVVDNHDGSLQIIIVKLFGSSINQILNTKKSHKSFTVTPNMMYDETESIFNSFAD